MRRTFLLAIAIGLSACATLTPKETSRCAGPRRPANPHGSVLELSVSPPAQVSGGQCLGGRP